MKMIDYNLLKGKITAMQSTEPEYAFNFLNNAQNPSTEWECIEDMIDSMEVYEAEPVKRGYWENTSTPNQLRCSNCDVIHFIAQYPHGDINYCPNCGADMRGDTE